MNINLNDAYIRLFIFTSLTAIFFAIVLLPTFLKDKLREIAAEEIEEIKQKELEKHHRGSVSST